MKKFSVTLDRRNERKTITVDAMSFPGARNSALAQFPDWEIWLVRDASPSPLAEAVEIARGAPPSGPVRFS